jgi:hypothetical protein
MTLIAKRLMSDSRPGFEWGSNAFTSLHQLMKGGVQNHEQFRSVQFGATAAIGTTVDTEYSTKYLQCAHCQSSAGPAVYCVR